MGPGTEVVKKREAGVECEICLAAMGYLQGILADKSTEATLKEELKKLCVYLPAEMQKTCDTAIDTYADQVIQLLIEQLVPKTICTGLGLCTANKQVLKMDKSNPFAASVSCGSSEFMMGFLDHRMREAEAGSDPKVQLKWLMAAMCVKLPQGNQAECNTFVQKYGSKIISLLVDHKLKPKLISKHIGLCTLGDSQIKYIANSNYKLGFMRPNSISCSICKYSMGYVVSALKSEKSEKAIANKFEKYVCEKLPNKVLVNECDQLIVNYGGELVDLLLEKVDGMMLCEALEICE